MVAQAQGPSAETQTRSRPSWVCPVQAGPVTLQAKPLPAPQIPQHSSALAVSNRDWAVAREEQGAGGTPSHLLPAHRPAWQPLLNSQPPQLSCSVPGKALALSGPQSPYLSNGQRFQAAPGPGGTVSVPPLSPPPFFPPSPRL